LLPIFDELIRRRTQRKEQRDHAESPWSSPPGSVHRVVIPHLKADPTEPNFVADLDTCRTFDPPIIYEGTVS
jgi:hypothetical protein